jgi:RHS repeat-associated protein
MRRPLEMERLPNLATSFAGDRHWYQTDGLDSVVALTDESGALASPFLYDEYGQLLAGTTELQLFAYTGQDYDVETGLYHFYARYYSASLGVWIQADTYKKSVRAKFELGSYIYVRQNPISLYDFLGFRPAPVKDNSGTIEEWTDSSHKPEMDPEVDNEVEPTRKCCGPNVTNWLIQQMNTNKNHPAIKTLREERWALWIPFFNLGWIAGAMEDFYNLVRTGGPWDFKNLEDYKSATTPGNGTGCPSEGCDRTVTICGTCFDYDVPGNIHYGWVGRMATWRDWLLHFGADWAQVGLGGMLKGKGDDPKDKVAVDIGEDLADNGGGDICSPVLAHKNELRLGPNECEACNFEYTGE